MKLYHSPQAPNPERVTKFLKAKGKLDAVEIEELSIMKQEHKSDDYRKVSPFSQVPALVLDDGTTLTESRAICTYLEGVFPEPNLMGDDPKEKALIEMWDRRVELMLFLQFATWFRNSHPAMAPLEVPQLPEVGAKAEKSAKAMAKRIDARLADNDFLAAGRFSIADITLYCFCGFAGVMKWKPHEEFENIGKWRERAKAEIG
ncbi:glutathione S-transferase family protein [Henriciella litoralis]|uniref:glutathione S-transferase family protein n=1 Tax=Henriciella litoralis TaxID=568102 RepID=UPI0009FE8FDA|nr:glutathione S-transferase family protein [Henriciella litoralis]